MELNSCQSSIESLELERYPEEVREQFFDFINNVPFIKYMISADRPHACDLPRDEEGKIIFDITKPPLLDDMDYFRPAALHFKKTGRYTMLRPNPNPKSEYGKWIREEIRRCHEGVVRPSDGMWITGDMYFMLNYFPMFITKITGKSKKGERVFDFPEVWEGINLRFHYINQAINGGMYDKEGGRNGCEISSRGKAHPYSQTVYTPKGKAVWGDIKIGDLLFGDDGETTMVMDIPFDGVEDIYRITLKDGREVYSSGNHLWRVWRSSSNAFKTLSTKEMMDDFWKPRKITEKTPKGKEYIYRIPNHGGVNWKHKDTLVDPYTFGLLLGGGCFRHDSCCFSQSPEDFEVEKRNIPYETGEWSGRCQHRIHIPEWTSILKEYGLYDKKGEDKFIPEEYIYNSKETRLNLLRGLMDSCGFTDSNGVPIIGMSSKRMADGIAFVARSLGYNCLQSVKKTGYKDSGKHKKCLDRHIVRIFTNDLIFLLGRKQNLVTGFGSVYSRSNRDFSTIVNIEYSHTERCKCVTVGNSSHCYLIGDFVTTHNSKSYTMASMMAKRFILGESFEVNKGVKCMATAYQKQYLTSDGILNKFQAGIDFLAEHTEFPRRRLRSSLQDMSWKMGYTDLDTGTQRGTLNEVIGVSAKDDTSKVRGKRQNLIVIEEFGSFRNVLELYNILIPSVQEGDISFGSMYLIGTAGDDESDFQGAQEIVYNPKGYRMYPLPNAFDVEGQGRREMTFFFPGYINRKGCYDSNGNSDITKALLEILENRYRVKYNSSDVNSITKTIAEIPVTPQEAILRTRGNIFPMDSLNARLVEIDSNPSEYNDVYAGTLVQKQNGTVEFMPTSELPIRDFPLKDNKLKGAIEIFQMPEKDKDGNVFQNRYILGHDPVDDDTANTLSLTSTFVLDLFTDRIVAEYTGRQDYADDNFEIVRLLCLFYNGKCCYEQNKKGLFAYFSSHSCVHLLADTPRYLKDKQIIKEIGYGNKSKGIMATAAINNYANDLIRNWLIKPVTEISVVDGVEQKAEVPNLHFIRNRALLKELILFNPLINVDRVRALGMVMLYRQEFMIMYQGNLSAENMESDKSALSNDPFFQTFDKASGFI